MWVVAYRIGGERWRAARVARKSCQVAARLYRCSLYSDFHMIAPIHRATAQSRVARSRALCAVKCNQCTISWCVTECRKHRLNAAATIRKRLHLCHPHASHAAGVKALAPPPPCHTSWQPDRSRLRSPSELRPESTAQRNFDCWQRRQHREPYGEVSTMHRAQPYYYNLSIRAARCASTEVSRRCLKCYR